MIKLDHDNQEYEIKDMLLVDSNPPAIDVVNKNNHYRTVITDNTLVSGGWRDPNRIERALMWLKVIPRSRFMVWATPNSREE